MHTYYLCNLPPLPPPLLIVAVDWTVSLTKYMQECVWRICNETNPLSRQETLTGRHSSSSGAQAALASSEEGLAELTRWQYMVYLSSWLYQVRDEEACVGTTRVCFNWG